MLARSIPLGPAEAAICFDPARWVQSCDYARTAYRGLAASAVMACCGHALPKIEGLEFVRFDRKAQTLTAPTAYGPDYPVHVLPLAAWALNLMREHSGHPEAKMLFVTGGGLPMPHGNLREQLIAFGLRHGIAENLPTSLAATFREAIGEGPIADALRGVGLTKRTVSAAEQRRYLEAVHPLAKFQFKARPRSSPEERLLTAALACRKRRTLEKDQREAVRLAEFPVLFEFWKVKRLSANQFAMHLGLDNVHRWIRRFRKHGIDGLRHKSPDPDRHNKRVVELRMARGASESVASFHEHLREQGIRVGISWLEKTLGKLPTGNNRTEAAKWRRVAIREFRRNEPVKNATALWRKLRAMKTPYPYTRFTLSKTVRDAGLKFTSPWTSNGRTDAATKRKIATLHQLHSPVMMQSEFIALLRNDHDIALTIATLRDILEEAGIRIRREVTPAMTRKIVRLWSERSEGTGIKAFWRYLRDKHDFDNTLTCVRSMLMRLGLFTPRPMTKRERERWSTYYAERPRAAGKCDDFAADGA